jgi:hypothetical protein
MLLFLFFFVKGDSVGLYRYSFVDDGEQSSFAWPQKKKKRKTGRIDDPFFFVFYPHPFFSASWIQYLQIVAD